MIKITVVICTYNRAKLLIRALDSLTKQSIGKKNFEVLIINNASTDDTDKKTQGFIEYNSEFFLRLLYEENQGLSYARNRGIKEASGNFIAFLDDDAVADPDWLKTALDAFHNTQPVPLAIGGPILPLYETSRPYWFKDKYEIRTWGDKNRFLYPNEAFSGSNMIFKKSILERYGGFDISLGIKGNHLSLAEESDLINRINRNLHSDKLFYYVTNLKVYHSVPEVKMKVSYQLKRHFVIGQNYYKLYGSDSFKHRLKSLCIYSLNILTFIANSLKNRRNYKYHQNWFIENFTKVTREFGLLTAALGLRIRILQNMF